MKKWRLFQTAFYSIFFILFFCVASDAQIQFGVKAGYNSSNTPFMGDAHYTYKDLSAFNAGIMASIPLPAHLVLKSEIVYSIQGIVAVNHATLGDQNIKYSYYYLNFPVLIEYKHATGLFVETGLQLGILLSANSDDGHEFHFNETPYLQPGDLSWVFGLGYEISKINLGFNVRYNLGITNTSRYEGIYLNNRVFQMGIFYFFKKL